MSWRLIRSRRSRRIAVAGVVLVLLVSAPWIWTTAAATGHVHDVADAPAAGVVIVLATTVTLCRSLASTRTAFRQDATAAVRRCSRRNPCATTSPAARPLGTP